MTVWKLIKITTEHQTRLRMCLANVINGMSDMLLQYAMISVWRVVNGSECEAGELFGRHCGNTVTQTDSTFSSVNSVHNLVRKWPDLGIWSLSQDSDTAATPIFPLLRITLSSSDFGSRERALMAASLGSCHRVSGMVWRLDKIHVLSRKVRHRISYADYINNGVEKTWKNNKQNLCNVHKHE